MQLLLQDLLRLLRSEIRQLLEELGPLAREDRDREQPALTAPGLPIANVATGIPPGICTVARSESRPLSDALSMGTPRTGSVVCAAATPARCAAPPAPATRTSRPRAAAARDVLRGLFRRAVGREHAALARDAELRERLGDVLHDLPVGLRAHQNADERLRIGAHGVTLPGRASSLARRRNRTG